MSRKTAAEVASAVKSVGWTGSDIVMMTAIALAESNAPPTNPATANTDIPNSTKVNAEWGPAVGVFQIRSKNAERGKGTTRDELALTDFMFNVRAAKQVADDSVRSGQSQFYPWEAWQRGMHVQFLAQAKIAAGQAALDESQLPKHTPAATSSTTSGQHTGAVGGASDGAAGGVALVINQVAPTTFSDVAKAAVDNLEGDYSTLIGDVITDVSFDLTADKVAELTLTIVDDYLAVAESIDLTTEPPLGFGGLNLVVAAKESSGGDEGTGITVLTCRSKLVQKLRHNTENAGIVFAGMSRSQLVQQLVQAASTKPSVLGTGAHPGPPLGLVIKTSDATVPDLTVHAANTETGSLPESDWEAMERFAQELGWWLFEASGTIFFGPPTFLVTYMPTVPIKWGPNPIDTLIEMPMCRQTADDKDLGATITVRVAAELGIALRPGMALDVSGMADPPNGYNGIYIITGVKGQLDPASVWEITGATPKDPAPSDKTLAAGALANPTNVTGAAGSSPGGTTYTTGGSGVTSRIDPGSKLTSKVTGDYDTLRKQLLSTPSVSFADAGKRRDIEQGGAGVNGAPTELSERLLRVLVYLSRRHSFTISSVISSHPTYVNGASGGKISPHKSGHGIDFNVIDGVHISNSGAGLSKATEIANELMDIMDADTRPTQVSKPDGSTLVGRNGVTVFSDHFHNDNLHITG